MAQITHEVRATLEITDNEKQALLRANVSLHSLAVKGLDRARSSCAELHDSQELDCGVEIDPQSETWQRVSLVCGKICYLNAWGLGDALNTACAEVESVTQAD